MVEDFSIEKIEQLVSKTLPKRFKRGEFLYRLDEPVDKVMLLIKGYVRHYTISSKGEEYTLNILKPHSLFPLPLALNSLHNPYYFEAMGEVAVKVIDILEVLKYFESDPRSLLSLTKKLASGLNQLSVRSESLLFGTASQKLATVLCLLGKRFGHSARNKKEVIVVNAFKITHRLLASMTALTRETVSLEMMELKNQGLIDYQRQQVVINDYQQLVELSSLPFYFEK